MRRNRGLSWDSIRLAQEGPTARLFLNFHLVLNFGSKEHGYDIVLPDWNVRLRILALIE
jgi:hypothetical protein